MTLSGNLACLMCRGDGRILVQSEDRKKLITYRCSCPAADKWSENIKRWENKLGEGELKVVKQF